MDEMRNCCPGALKVLKEQAAIALADLKEQKKTNVCVKNSAIRQQTPILRVIAIVCCIINQNKVSYYFLYLIKKKC